MRHLFAVALLLLSCAAATAFKVAPTPTLAARTASADVVVFGTVSSIEEKPVLAAPYPGATDKVEFTIAVVKVSESLKGAKGATHIKVGMPAGKRGPTVVRDEEVCLFVRKHPDENFYVLSDFGGKLDPKGTNFKTELAEIKKTAAILAKPTESLKAKEAADRYRAATVLLMHYRPLGQDLSKAEAIDADESKLILTALLDGDWKAPVRGGDPMSPTLAFSYLGVTEKDGFKFTGGNYQEEAQKWLKDNAGKFKIKKYVRDEK